jgi:transposase-like protein
MAQKSRYENKAWREWWSVHIEAWQRSGLSQRKYCARHRLTTKTFARWVKVLTDAAARRIQAELASEERRERRRRRRFRLSGDKRCQAVQAFWAMHVEAMNWSGMSVREYAATHRISPYSLRRWRNLLDDGEVVVDWRARLHPSARPKISSDDSSAANARSVETVLTAPSTDDPPGDRRSNRRSFTDEEKIAIVLEAEQPSVSVAAVCRHHDIATSMVFRWRVQLGFGQGERARLAAVRLTDERSSARSMPVVLRDLLQPPDGMTAVELDDGRRVFAPIGSDPVMVRRQVAEREATP